MGQARSGHVTGEVSFEVHHHDNMLLTVIPESLNTPVTNSGALTTSLFSWNVHWQCGSDHLPGCRAFAAARFVNLTRSTHASIAVAIELESNSTTPLALDSPGLLEGWQTVAGSCSPTAPAATGDALMLAIDPAKFIVQASSGGCLGGVSGYGYKADSRAFAVAAVRPVTPVQGCASLCIVGLHAPHVNVTRGASTVERVCGSARAGCVVAAGDWNAGVRRRGWWSVPNATVSARWAELIGNDRPPALTVAAPDVNSCCYPQTKYLGPDDHVATNVQGATLLEATTFPYQLGPSLGFSDTEEHMPIHVALALPEATQNYA